MLYKKVPCVQICGNSACFSMGGTKGVHKFRAVSLLAGMKGLLFNFISFYCLPMISLLFAAVFLFCLLF